MIVYGDPHFRETLGSLVDSLKAHVQLLRSERMAHGLDLDRLRSLLILAGQVEQAAEDALPNGHEPERVRLRLATDLAAAAFCARWAATGTSQVDPSIIGEALERLAVVLDGEFETRDADVTVKVPEGFAFYTLFPDAYCAAARRWLEDRADAAVRRVVVVGIRSIGTTLSAVVAATLEAGCWNARRATVRPTGHPFSRRAAIPRELTGPIRQAAWGLVVDEGPGLSGSSMASVADTLVAAGLPPERIAFFPGHAGEPGPSAAPEARAWWRVAPRFVTRHEDVRLDGASIPEALAETTRRFVDRPDDAVEVEDLGGGAWRRAVYSASSAWPAACAPFERAKYRCTTARGERVLFKFGGLAWEPGPAGGPLVTEADAYARQLGARAAAGWSPAPLGVAHGFVATPWIEGTPLRASDADATTLDRLGRYLAESAGPPLSPFQEEQALGLARDIVRWNTKELLGDKAAERAERWASFTPAHARPLRSSGDGHLAPHEWIRSDDGRIWKMDPVGHDRDHTAVGLQPLAWDVAGALVEWECDDAATAQLLEAFGRAGGAIPPGPTLAYYRLAYAAYRAGQCRHCAESTADNSAERARLERARDRHLSEMTRVLESPPT